MKQKYEITRLPESGTIRIREYAELDKEIQTLLCEQQYGQSVIQSAMERGREELIAAFRNRHFYPHRPSAERLADALKTLLSSNENDSAEVFVDDAEFLSERQSVPEFLPQIEDEAEDLDELVEEEFEEDVDEDFEDKLEIKKVSSPLQIAEDDIADLDEEP